WEYLTSPEKLRNLPPPTWSLPPSLREKVVAGLVKWWQTRVNHEASSPPVYYAVAAVWYDLLGALGFAEATSLYSIRFLNAVFAALLVVVSYAAARRFFPDRMALRLGVPLLVAAFPQDVQYVINNDALSPLLGALSFFLLAQITINHQSRRWYFLAAGLAATSA